MKDGSPRILIIRLSAIGDVVRALPALHVLREAFPDAHIDWIVERKSAEIVAGHPLLDETFVFDRTSNLFHSASEYMKLLNAVRADHYDYVLDLHGILKSGILSLFSGAPVRIGFAPPRGRELSYLCANRWVRLGASKMNRVEENLAACGALVPRVGYPTITLFVPPEIQDAVESYFEATFDAGKMVVNIHVPVDRAEKQWPLEYYAELSDMLIADGRFETLLTWGPGQFPIIEEVVRRSRRAPNIAPEMPSLKYYAWLVHLCDLYFGGDTGPMHIASAMDTPVVAVFGGTDPARHSPYRPPFRILFEPDTGGVKRRVAERLRRVTPELAYDACIKLITDTAPMRRPKVG